MTYQQKISPSLLPKPFLILKRFLPDAFDGKELNQNYIEIGRDTNKTERRGRTDNDLM